MLEFSHQKYELGMESSYWCLLEALKIMGEVIPVHWNKFWGTTESLLRRGGNVATVSMSAQITTMPALIVD